ncbi:hypothetical protein EX30DRAFT_371889 [Ascodesmis nigricans]|uniref:Uncharacterized protein n=1 Tax=Ascodesmis nigricans TaxID=341454 RepID=A0A4S2MW50_9PEZI|nr:hypothetical protein EX30DRAFT_371889 [Ascodesmis nigricans]
MARDILVSMAACLYGQWPGERGKVVQIYEWVLGLTNNGCNTDAPSPKTWVKTFALSRLFESMGDVPYRHKDYETALKCYARGLEVGNQESIATGETFEIVKYLRYMGSVYAFLGNYTMALEHYKQALDHTELLVGKDSVSSALIFGA